MGIVHSDQVGAYEYDKGIWVKKLAVPETGTESISVGVATFDPGASLPCHIHDCEESITIIEGEALVEFAGRRVPLKPYDTSHMPAGTPHRFLNASQTERMSILWVYASADMGRTLVDPGECTGSPDSLDRRRSKGAP
jgi:quercetin dioxygenase-like cupin family protein